MVTPPWPGPSGRRQPEWFIVETFDPYLSE